MLVVYYNVFLGSFPSLQKHLSKHKRQQKHIRNAKSTVSTATTTTPKQNTVQQATCSSKPVVDCIIPRQGTKYQVDPSKVQMHCCDNIFRSMTFMCIVIYSTSESCQCAMANYCHTQDHKHCHFFILSKPPMQFMVHNQYTFTKSTCIILC